MSVRTYVITTVCILSVIVGFLGNLVIVIVRIYKHYQRKQTTTYAFLICQLAIADFLFALTVMFDIHALLHEDIWLFGVGVCKFIKTLQSTSVSTTIGFLTLMAYERYCGLSRPLQHHWSIKKTSIIVVGIWMYIIMTFIPFTFALGVEEGICFEINHPSETFRKGYTMFLFITNFVIPLLCIIIFHSLIVRITRKHLRSIGRNSRHRGSSRTRTESDNDSPSKEKSTNSSSSKKANSAISIKTKKLDIVTSVIPQYQERLFTCFDSIKKLFKKKKQPMQLLSPNTIQLTQSPQNKPRFSLRKRVARTNRNYEDSKLVKMLVAVTLSFAFMTLPTQIWYIWYDFGGSEGQISPLVLNILEVFASLVYMHCCVNCIIYSAMDKRFRTDVISMFRILCKKNEFQRNATYLSTVTSRRSRTNSSRLDAERESLVLNSSPNLSPNLSPVIKSQKYENKTVTINIETVM